MDLAHFRTLINELLNKDTYIVPEEDTIIRLDSNSDVCMANKGKDNKNTRHIDRRVHFVRNGEKWKINNIDWCKRGIQLAYIATKNAGENDLNPRIKYIMVRLDN